MQSLSTLLKISIKFFYFYYENKQKIHFQQKSTKPQEHKHFFGTKYHSAEINNIEERVYIYSSSLKDNKVDTKMYFKTLINNKFCCSTKDLVKSFFVVVLLE